MNWIFLCQGICVSLSSSEISHKPSTDPHCLFTFLLSTVNSFIPEHKVPENSTNYKIHLAKTLSI